MVNTLYPGFEFVNCQRAFGGVADLAAWHTIAWYVTLCVVNTINAVVVVGSAPLLSAGLTTGVVIGARLLIAVVTITGIDIPGLSLGQRPFKPARCCAALHLAIKSVERCLTFGQFWTPSFLLIAPARASAVFATAQVPMQSLCTNIYRVPALAIAMPEHVSMLVFSNWLDYRQLANFDASQIFWGKLTCFCVSDHKRIIP